MGFFQCPRCFGNDSFKQSEQQLRGYINGSWGIVRKRQRYCRRCSSVKMDYRKTASDWWIVSSLTLILIVIPSIKAFSDSPLKEPTNSIVNLTLILTLVSIFLSVFFLLVFARKHVPKGKPHSLNLASREARRLMSLPKAFAFAFIILLFFNVVLGVTVKLNTSTIDCIKGQTSKTITAPEPKCPTGYKIKKWE